MVGVLILYGCSCAKYTDMQNRQAEIVLRHFKIYLET